MIQSSNSQTCYIDELTTLLNRKKLLVDLDSKEFKLLFLLNIDDFSGINTVYGLEVGDLVLKNIATKILELKLEVDYYAYRVSGDEFAIVFFEKFKNINKIKEVCRNILIFVANNIRLVDDNILAINLTSGIAFGQDDVLLKAQLALKVARKNNLLLTIFKESHRVVTRKKYNDIKNLAKYKEALLFGDLLVYYQPIVCNLTDKKVKYEALCRLKYKDEIISPYYFIPLSKQLKIYNRISIEIVKKAINDFIDKKEMVSINISMEDVCNKYFTKEILKIAQEYKRLDNIIFEITESSNIKNYMLINKFIKRISPFGIHISLDDFGTEYSNFEHISKIDANYLKIDGTFVHDIDVNQKNYKLVESIVELCKKLGIKTVAEYVSSEEIYKTVKEIGVDYSQGFYFGEAKPIENI